MKLSKTLSEAREVYDLVKSGKTIEEIAAEKEISQAALSYRRRVWELRQKFKLYDLSYGQIAALVTVPESMLPDFLNIMNINSEISVRQIKARVLVYKEHNKTDLPNLDSDYVFISGRRFFVPPEVVPEIMRLIGVEDWGIDPDANGYQE